MNLEKLPLTESGFATITDYYRRLHWLIHFVKTNLGHCSPNLPLPCYACCNRGGQTMSDTATILSVEDDDDLRQLVGEVLTHAGFRVLSAESGEAALRVLKSEERV